MIASFVVVVVVANTVLVIHLLVNVFLCMCDGLAAICFIEILFITPKCLHTIQETWYTYIEEKKPHISTERLSLYSPIGTSQKRKQRGFFSFTQLNSNWKKKSNNNNAKIKYIDETHSIQSIYVKMFEPLKYYNVFFSLDWGKIYNMLQINTQNVYATLCGKKRIK